MSHHIELMQGTGVQAVDRAEAKDIVDSVIGEHENSNSDLEIIRLTTTANDDGSYTVAVNVKDSGYTEDTAASTQKSDFETTLRNIHSKIDAELPSDVTDNMEVARR